MKRETFLVEFPKAFPGTSMGWLISGLMGIWRGLPYQRPQFQREIRTQAPHEA